MRILFLAPKYQSLYLPILQELERGGNDVVFIEDYEIPGDHYRHSRSILWELYRCVKRAKSSIQNVFQDYWARKIDEMPQLSSSFDLLFVINGCSFDITLLEHLRAYNSVIRSVLYVWDTDKYYNYHRNFKFFDKVFSFDFADANKYSVSFLPFYWTESEVNNVEPEFLMTIVGTNHDGRFSIVKAVADQLDQKGISNYRFCILTERRPLYLFERIGRFLAVMIGRKDRVADYDLISGAIDSPLVITSPMTIDEINSLINRSEIVLDTDRESQMGTTPRVIWAMANGKRIVTTNTFLKRLPFYSADRISFIDRKNPILDWNFIKLESAKDMACDPYIEGLRLDRWVSRIIKIDS